MINVSKGAGYVKARPFENGSIWLEKGLFPVL